MTNRMIFKPPFMPPKPKQPVFSNDGLLEATRPTPDSSAGMMEISRLEALVLACWREGNLDLMRTLVNSRTGPHGLKLVWSDPLVEGLDE